MVIPSVLQEVLDSIIGGEFGEPSIFMPLIETITKGGDYYCIAADFEEYLKCKKRAREQYKKEYTKQSILNTSKSGYFSADRSIKEYCDKIWNVEGLHVPENWEMSDAVLKKKK